MKNDPVNLSGSIVNMSRQYCEQCAYPISTCVCSAVEKLILPIRIIVLQHKKESKHAKNTVRLVKLVSPDIEIIDVSDYIAVSKIADSLTFSNVIVLYPNNTSIPLERYIQEQRKKTSAIENPLRPITLILIDANWRQAYGIWKHHEWLNILPHCHFAVVPEKQYEIRKSKKIYQLSTIEALAHSVEIICGVSGKPYLNVFTYMQKHWLSHQHY